MSEPTELKHLTHDPRNARKRTAEKQTPKQPVTEHATVQREGYTVPLIGIPKTAVLQECDCCHEENPLAEVELQPAGQMLCTKCR